MGQKLIPVWPASILVERISCDWWLYIQWVNMLYNTNIFTTCALVQSVKKPVAWVSGAAHSSVLMLLGKVKLSHLVNVCCQINYGQKPGACLGEGYPPTECQILYILTLNFGQLLALSVDYGETPLQYSLHFFLRLRKRVLPINRGCSVCQRVSLEYSNELQRCQTRDLISNLKRKEPRSKGWKWQRSVR